MSLFAITPPARKSHDVHTTLNYYQNPKDGFVHPRLHIGRPETYFQGATQHLPVVVKDVRWQEHLYSLDSTGFQFYQHRSVVKDFTNDKHIKAVYYPEVENFLKDATGATRVYIFDHTIRGQPQDTTNNGSEWSKASRKPFHRVHIDQSYSAAQNRVAYHLPDDAEKLSKVRHQIINVWRPIKKILKDPLAVADANSVPRSDLVPVRLIHRGRAGETYTVRPNKKHKWYFLYG